MAKTFSLEEQGKSLPDNFQLLKDTMMRLANGEISESDKKSGEKFISNN